MITGKKKMCAVIYLITIMVSTFAEDLYSIKVSNDLYGFINSSGELIIPAEYTKVSRFSDDIATVQDINGYWYSIDKKGNIVFNFGKEYDYISMFSEGLAAITIIDESNVVKEGYINMKGEVVIEPQYESASLFSDGFALVYYNYPDYFYINKKGENVFNKTFSDAWSFSEGYACVRIEDKDTDSSRRCFLDTEGNEINLPDGYRLNTPSQDDRYVCLEKDDNYYFWNLKTKKIIDVEKGYEAYGLCDGVYTVRSQETNKTGLKNLEGEWVLPCTYTRVLTMGEGFASYKNQKGYRVIIDKKGKQITDTTFYDLRDFNGELAIFYTWELPYPAGYVSKDGQIFYCSDY